MEQDERRAGMEELNRRLRHVEDQLATVIHNQGNVMRTLDEVGETARDVVVEIGGAPDEIGRDPSRRSLRRRMHELENDRSAAQAAAAAVAASKQFYTAAADKRFTKREKMIAVGIAAFVAISPYIAPFIH